MNSNLSNPVRLYRQDGFAKVKSVRDKNIFDLFGYASAY